MREVKEGIWDMWASDCRLGNDIGGTLGPSHILRTLSKLVPTTVKEFNDLLVGYGNFLYQDDGDM